METADHCKSRTWIALPTNDRAILTILVVCNPPNSACFVFFSCLVNFSCELPKKIERKRRIAIPYRRRQLTKKYELRDSRKRELHWITYEI